MVGRKPEGKVKKKRINTTMDQGVLSAIRKVTSNLSRFLEDAARDKLKKIKRSGHKRDMEF